MSRDTIPMAPQTRIKCQGICKGTMMCPIPQSCEISDDYSDPDSGMGMLGGMLLISAAVIVAALAALVVWLA